MSPQVLGRVTDKGQAVAGVRVTRKLIYEGYEKGKEQTEYAITDTDGRFSFERKVIKSRMPGDIFGQNMPVLQSIYIEKNIKDIQGDDYYFLWSTSKSWDPIQPLSDLLLQLNADLQNKKVKHLIDATDYGGLPRQVVGSICHWQGELISTYYNNELITSYDEIT
ncbi:DUF6795 domain-containing protein [Thalassomonas actiniarum]|uniref:Carboxypeptidase regulatory-like domain-containing protein n=1 Tax=Thalassomonas actiniarum TaxID=485447 RepID=A0AAE9YPP3_9GAMM|nr:carboxypeptidase-like regulatory domain-containing protein [Thalassomonas actiniarum]WDD97938.1 carboxypeptidase regulatory-like domain-containing protein [Thalassomonas actiniarum]